MIEKRVYAGLAFLVGSWALAAGGMTALQTVARWTSWRLPSEPTLPYLASVARQGETCVTSSVPHFIEVLLLSALALTIAEIGKLLLAAEGGPRERVMLGLTGVYQGVLCWDTLRAQAFDWYIYLLSVIGVVGLPDYSSRTSEEGFARTVIPIASPMSSLLFLTCLVATIWYIERGRAIRKRSNEGKPPSLDS